MLTYLLGLFISLAAGSVFIYNPPKNKKWISFLLSAGGAYLIAIIFTHILPELFEVMDPHKAGIVLLIGYLLQILLENYSKGIEHGHSHGSQNKKALTITFAALCIHALVEGMPLASILNGNTIGFDQQLAVGIMLHKIPVAITLSTMLLKSGLKKNQAFLMLLGFIFSTVLGSALQLLIGNQFAENAEINMFYSLGLTIGILLHVSTTILMESSESHRLTSKRLIVISIGLAFGLIS